MYEYQALVIEVVDGDTCHILVDLGFSISQKMIVRMYSINAPELHAKDPKPGQDAKDYLKSLIDAKQVTINTHKDEKEKYGRMLAEIYLPGDAISVNQKMIERGYAVAYFGGAR